MPTTSLSCAPGASSKPARTKASWRQTAGTPASGNISNWKKVSMRSETRQAVSLLREAAWPERHHLYHGVAWLMLAAGLEMLGPYLGKSLIDNHLLPHQLDWPHLIVLIGGYLLSGCVASILRYL